MVFAVVKLIAADAVAKFVPAQHADGLHRLQAAIDCHGVTFIAGKAGVQFFGGKRAVFAQKKREHGPSWRSHAHGIVSEFAQGGGEGGGLRGVGRRRVRRHDRVDRLLRHNGSAAQQVQLKIFARDANFYIDQQSHSVHISPHMKYEDFQQQLAAEQKRLRMTQAELATVLGVKPRAVWNWLNRKMRLPAVLMEGVVARLEKAAVAQTHAEKKGGHKMNIQLLTDCESPEHLFVSPLWACEEKMDGDWRQITKDAQGVRGLTREGNPAALSAETVALAMLCPFDFIIEGEQMPGGRFVAFDIVALMGKVCADKENAARREILCQTWPGEVVKRVIGEQAKRDLCDEIRARGGEGIVFKRVDAPYRVGRTPFCQRYKNYETEVFTVGKVEIAKCSFEVLRDGVSFGKVPCASFNRLPKSGDTVRVKYERVTDKGKLLRAVYV